jgi:F0F1-type ATP synthase membrane subunit a
VANELNELQCEYRYVKPETTLLWFVFFIKALGWEQLAQANPDMRTDASELAPTNYVLKFFLSAFIFLCVMAVQYILEGLNSYFSSLKFQEFMDLCSVSNISVLIMDQ